MTSLVGRFLSHRDYYTSPEYEETSARDSFINPFFQALGWDVTDEAGLGPAREVIVHRRIARSVEVAGEEEWDNDLTAEELAERQPTTRIPDYAFFSGGTLRFFMEAKKPAVGLRQRAPAFQVKSYAWSQGIPVSVLANFAELRLFDCTLRPEYDRPEAGQIAGFDLTCEQYLDAWDALWDALSRESVANGSLERIAQESRRRTRGAIRVDQSFLEELSTWRARIAENLVQHNIDLTSYELAEATQRIIDRIVFLRVVEDREIEPTVVLRRFARTTDAYRRLTNEFRRLDVVYNGQLFSEHFSERLELEDGTIQRFIESLYYPISPYRFDVIGADLLGAVYERFLGKELEIADGSVRLVDKPEVRHAGGVYYTPSWVVDRIVSATLGPCLEGRTPRTAGNLRVLDPACGSGSFLLGALDYLISWHEAYYSEHPDETTDRHYLGADGKRRLTVEAKSTILANSIFGVDIDPQAVEVTQMSLYVKVLEGEDSRSLSAHPRLFHSAYLPPLTGNIVCGNSLLGQRDIPRETLFDQDVARRINPFDWRDDQRGFGRILTERGGFDAIIGNPPYTRTQALREFRAEEADTYARIYRAASEGSFDIAGLFVERMLPLLRSTGRLGFIISRQFTEADYGRPLRALLAEGGHVLEIIDFEAGLVFEGVGAYTLILVATPPSRRRTYRLTRVSERPSRDELANAESSASPYSADVPTMTLTPQTWDLALPAETELLARLATNYPSLGRISGNTIFQGVVTGADVEVFRLLDLGQDPLHPQCRRVTTSRQRGSEERIEAELLKPVFAGRSDIQRFIVRSSAELLLMPYERDSPRESFVLIPPARLAERFPFADAWLRRNEQVLRARAGSWTDENWYSFSRRQNLERFAEPKVLVPYMVEHLCGAFDAAGHYFVNVSTGGYGIPVTDGLDPEYLAALLNSRLLSWVLKRYSRAWRGGWFAARNANLARLPIVLAPQTQQSLIVQLYRACIQCTGTVDSASADLDREIASRVLATAVVDFDAAVEELYALSPREALLITEAGAA